MTLAALTSDAPPRPVELPAIEEVYDQHVDFVARTARALGVPAGAVDDVVQDVFLVVHRRLGEFEGRSTLKTWIAGIVLNVVRSHRRAFARDRGEVLPEEPVDPSGKSPGELALEREALRILRRILDDMPEEQRTVFVLAEIEGLEVGEIAGALGLNVNTAHSRLRLARKHYERGVARVRARDGWRQR